MYAGDELYGDDVTSGIQEARADQPAWPTPTALEPDVETLWEMTWYDEMEATDGCDGIEVDGYCEHGHPSWMRWLGLI